jgi:undecaprenyl-diphosphatase
MAMLIDLDHWLFKLINQSWTNSFFDSLFPFITTMKFTAPYVLILAGIWIALQRKRAVFSILCIMLSVGLADLTAAKLIKPIVHRDRPEFSNVNARLLTGTQGSPSFPSNHAANTSAMAFTLAATNPPLAAIGYIVAILVGYSRIYVGVHFPLDVLGGVLVGWLAAIVARRILRRLLAYYPKS